MRTLAHALRAVAERVEQGESLSVALRTVASELDSSEAAAPDWHLAEIDASLADPADDDEPWEEALAGVRAEVAHS